MAILTGYAVNTLEDLLAIPASQRGDRLNLKVISLRSWFQFEADAPDGGYIPNDNPTTGRWFPDVGLSGYSYTTANFTQPEINSNVTINIENSAWIPIGIKLFVATGGDYLVVDTPTLTTCIIKNIGLSGNAAVGTLIPSGSRITATGINGANGISSYTYIAYADDSTGTGFTNTFNASKDFIAVRTTTSPIASPIASDFTGLWKNYKGANGISSYTYIAYADDASGTGFTNTFNSSKDFIAVRTTTSPIASPIASDFTGLWKNYKGATGATGSVSATNELTLTEVSVAPTTSADQLKVFNKNNALFVRGEGNATDIEVALKKVRRNIVITSSSLANSAHQQTTFTASTGLICYQIQTDKPARIRLYNNTTKQSADVSRSVPATLQAALDFNASAAGLLLDVVTTNSLLTIPLSPIVNIATIPSSTSIPITITNLSGTTGTVQATLTIMEIE